MGFGETFKALSDPARRDILSLLREGRMSAGEIGAHFDKQDWSLRPGKRITFITH